MSESSYSHFIHLVAYLSYIHTGRHVDSLGLCGSPGNHSLTTHGVYREALAGSPIDGDDTVAIVSGPAVDIIDCKGRHVFEVEQNLAPIGRSGSEPL